MEPCIHDSTGRWYAERAASRSAAGGRRSEGAACAAVGRKRACFDRRCFCRAPQTEHATLKWNEWYAERDSVNYGIAADLEGGKRMSTGHSHLNLRVPFGNKKIRIPEWVSGFIRDLFPFSRNIRVHRKGLGKLWYCRRPDRRQANVHRKFAFKCSSPFLQIKKADTRMGICFFWYAERDSNPRPTDS